MPNQLPTLGAPMPPAASGSMPATNMGQILSLVEQGRRQQALAQALMSTGYVPNSGALGAFAQAFSAYRGNKLERNANETVAQALQRKFEEDSRLKQAEANANDPINQRTDYLKRSGMDPDSEAGRYYLLTGKLPPAANRGPMNVSPGGAIVDPSTGKVIYQAQFAPREASPTSLQSVDVPDGKSGSRRMNFDPRTGQYSDPFGGAAPNGNRAVKFTFPPGTPPEVIAAAQASAVTNGDMPGDSGLGYKPPEQKAAKPLPANIVNKLTKAAETADNTSTLLSGFKDEFAGNTLTGGLENVAGQLGGERIGIASEGQADWWQQYDRQKNQVRNELFGSALTPSEQAAFERADINPRMDPARIRSNLRMQESIVRKGLERQAKVWKANGYNLEAVDASVAPAPQSGGQDFSSLWSQ